VGEVGDRIVATVLGGYDGFRAWVYHLAVTPKERRKGYGRAMMRAIEQKLGDLGAPKINLQVRSSNTDVVEFYRHLDYKIEDHTSMGKRVK
jgi:ribosomal protein S18 acetylase RimI-like enzyme